jgi:hypothetical protein
MNEVRLNAKARALEAAERQAAATSTLRMRIHRDNQ